MGIDGNQGDDPDWDYGRVIGSRHLAADGAPGQLMSGAGPPKGGVALNEGIEEIFNGVRGLNRNGLPVHSGQATLS